MDNQCDIEECAKKVNLDIRKLAFQGVLSIGLHPLEYAKTLIQLGYEPFPPTESSFFGRPYLALPSTFSYIKYIKSVDGFFGCYRGLTPKLLEMVVATFAYNTASRCIGSDQNNETNDEEEDENQVRVVQTSSSGTGLLRAKQNITELKPLLKATGWELVAVTAKVVVSHPFHVVAIRTMAQFVGREEIYLTPFQTLRAIYRTEGISGLFSGLVPRLLCDTVYLLITSAVIYTANKYLGKERMTDTVTSLASNMLGNTFAYQFQVVSTVMAVNGSSLKIGNKPFAPIYSSGYEAWKALRETNQLKRGSSIIGRSFSGRNIVINGQLRPTGYFFGPIHSPRFA